jgi:hypothetical protein
MSNSQEWFDRSPDRPWLLIAVRRAVNCFGTAVLSKAEHMQPYQRGCAGRGQPTKARWRRNFGGDAARGGRVAWRGKLKRAAARTMERSDISKFPIIACSKFSFKLSGSLICVGSLTNSTLREFVILMRVLEPSIPHPCAS